MELALRLWDALRRLLSFALEPDQDPTLVVVPSPSLKHRLLLRQAAASLNMDRYLLFCSAVRPSSAACWASVDFTTESCSSHSSRYSGWAISFGQQRVLFESPPARLTAARSLRTSATYPNRCPPWLGRFRSYSAASAALGSRNQAPLSVSNNMVRSCASSVVECLRCRHPRKGAPWVCMGGVA